jgi:hypothetical protein
MSRTTLAWVGPMWVGLVGAACSAPVPVREQPRPAEVSCWTRCDLPRQECFGTCTPTDSRIFTPEKCREVCNARFLSCLSACGGR